jgi:probable RNA-binding protein EIF1AD
MSRKKHIESEYLHGEIEAPKSGQCFARATGFRGGNIVEVEFADHSTALCLIPAKFNKKLWIRRGGVLIVEKPVNEAADAKVTGTVIAVLYAEHLKQMQKSGITVPSFGGASASPNETEHIKDEEATPNADSDDSLPAVPMNTNRRQQLAFVYTDSEEEDA